MILYRDPSTQYGTFGTLYDGDKILCCTLEDPWLNNKKNVSSVPAGTYSVVKHNSYKYSNVWRLEDVKGRTGILIHAGNTADDTSGCILVGRGIGTVKSKPAIINSQAALKSLRQYLPSNFTLIIKDYPKPQTVLPWWRKLLGD